MLAKFKSWPLWPCVFRVCLMLPFDTHHFVPDVQGGVFVFVFLYSFCATRFQTLPVSHKVSWPQVLQEMRRRCVQSRLNTCTDMMPPFPVVIVWYFVWLSNKCRHAAICFFSLPFFRLPTLVFPVLVLVVPGQSCPRPIPVTSRRLNSV